MRLVTCVIALVGAGIAGGWIHAQSGDSVAADSQTFELRTYTTEPGKLDALHARFRDHTTELFEQHGMTNVGYFVPTALTALCTTSASAVDNTSTRASTSASLWSRQAIERSRSAAVWVRSTWVFRHAWTWASVQPRR